ncbi:MAG: MaoC family dehydratase [Rhizobiaceae bacterium]|nr:MaoC family dehydratase [Rhizobiaceae bacterium]
MEQFRRPPISLEEMRRSVGKEVGVSDWRVVTQEMIDKFADATDDHQFIHVDPLRAMAETQFGGTIAHGFLTLSLLSTMAYEALPPLHNAEISINQGFERMRFIAPVRSGARIRARFDLVRLHARPSNWVEIGYDVTMEIENQTKPALALHWLTLSRIEQEQARA